MNSRFDAIIDVKERQRDEIAQRLGTLQGDINRQRARISKVIQDSLANHLAPEGSAALFNQYRTFQRAFQQERLVLEHELSTMLSHEQTLKQQLKDANIDFERFSHLRAEELKNYYDKQRHIEQKELDEFGTQSFNQQD